MLRGGEGWVCVTCVAGVGVGVCYLGGTGECVCYLGGRGECVEVRDSTVVRCLYETLEIWGRGQNPLTGQWEEHLQRGGGATRAPG